MWPFNKEKKKTRNNPGVNQKEKIQKSMFTTEFRYSLYERGQTTYSQEAAPRRTTTSSIKPTLDFDAISFTKNKSTVHPPINLNYQSPYRNSPVYSSFSSKASPALSTLLSPRTTKDAVRFKPLSKATYSPTKSATPTIGSPFSRSPFPIRAPLLASNTTPERLDDEIPSYVTTSRRRGEILIINNIMFPNSHEREGARLDHINLQKVFSTLGFKVHLKTDLTKTKMENELKSFSKRSELLSVDICVVAIMSHGTNQNSLGGYTEVFGIDGKSLVIDHVLLQFATEKCPAMAGKPKIFLFQCCRGDSDLVQSDAMPISYPTSFSDMLIAYSTLPGFVSCRDPKKGTWYIQTLCEVFTEYAKKHHVEDLLKIVDQRLSAFGGPKARQVSTYESRGFKRCYLNPVGKK